MIETELSRMHGQPITTLMPMEGGWEAELYQYQAGDKTCVVRIYNGDDGDLKVQREFEAMRALFQSGYPVPEVHFYATRQNSSFGKSYLVMDWIEGQVLGDAIYTEAGYQRFKALLDQLHDLEWRGHFDFSPEAPFAYVERKAAEFRAICEQVLPEFIPAIDWLDSQKTSLAAERFSILHWDFHPWNILHTPDDRLVVIDWSSMEIGDPQIDRAWTWLTLNLACGEAISERLASEYQITENAKAIVIIRRLATIYMTLTTSGEMTGLRDDASVKMRRELPALKRLYESYLSITDAPLPAVEGLFVE